MGRKHQDDFLLSRIEAARTLGVPAKVLTRLVKKRILEPAVRRGTKLFFYVSDIAGVAETLDERLTLPTVSARAFKAYAVAARTERKLTQVLEIFGATSSPLRTTEHYICSLYDSARRLAKRGAENISVLDLFDWTKTLLNMDEEYLMLMAYFTKDREPWTPFLFFTYKVASTASKRMGDKEFATAYGYFEFARRSFRQVAYFYCRMSHGATAAKKLFPEAHGDSLNYKLATLLNLAIEDRYSPRRLGRGFGLGEAV